ncbi:hypothetical protein AB0H51_28595 [Streptomyces griseoluteus]|uniref:hypothetical protein n=1 Tax=Streptomyces griseoluteus TaxID=29306 RepID=UPI0033EE89D9
MLRLWTCRHSPARNDGGGVRADAEIMLNAAGRAVLAGLCGVEPAVLARALPAFSWRTTTARLLPRLLNARTPGPCS